MGDSQCDYDVVVIFPYKEGNGSMAIKPNMPTYVHTMLGITRVKDQNGKWKQFRDTNHAIFRSDRCFLNDDGTPNSDLLALQKDIDDGIDLSEEHLEKLHDQKTFYMKLLLEKEYTSFNGNSDEPLMADKFCELVCKSVAKRLQRACGLSTTMKYGLNAKGEKISILMGITADAQDLRVEADRSNYKLQIHNRPFTDGPSHVNAPRFNVTFQKTNPEAWTTCKKTVHDRCEDTPDPSVDPGLFTEVSWQPLLRRGLQKAGHPAGKECSGLESKMRFLFGGGMYLAPYTDYRIDDHFQPLYRHYTDERTGAFTEFREVDRIRLVNQMIGRHLSLLSLKSKKMIIDSFALHNLKVKKDLLKTWVWDWRINPFMKAQPLLRIRDYFGEKIALYFAWLDFYTAQLRWPALFGFITFGMATTEETKATGLVLFAVFISFWGTYQSEMWKRRNALLNLWWGSTGSSTEDNAQIRPQFNGVLRRNPKTDQKEVFHRDLKQLRWRLVRSGSIISILVLLFLGATAFCFALKVVLIESCDLDDKPCRGQGAQIAGLSNAVVIGVGNVVALMLAQGLANSENHRTQHHYEHQYNLYTFVFRFCVTYASFFYVAFMKATAESTGCLDNDCMAELATQLSSIFISTFIAQNAFEALKPALYTFKRNLLANKGAKVDKGNLEQIEIEAAYEP
jgi:anoctamin-10